MYNIYFYLSLGMEFMVSDAARDQSDIEIGTNVD